MFLNIETVHEVHMFLIFSKFVGPVHYILFVIKSVRYLPVEITTFQQLVENSSMLISNFGVKNVCTKNVSLYASKLIVFEVVK